MNYLKRKGKPALAYHQTEGSAPGVIFLGGFRSDMTGVKAVALETFCKARGNAFLRFDYSGHGISEGKFEDGTIGAWKEDATAMLALTKGPQVLVGSSMGGWLAFLLAMAKPKRIAGIVGIAPAPDFTDRIYHDRFTDAERKEIHAKGRVVVPSDFSEPYPITLEFIEEGSAHMLLHDTIPVHCPVRILQGMQDKEVPWEFALSINEKLASQDVKTILVENGDHRLSNPDDIAKLLRVTGKLLDEVA